MRIQFCYLLIFFLTFPMGSVAEEITIKKDGSEVQLQGQFLVEQENAMLFQTTDGRIWPILSDQLVSRRAEETEFKPLPWLKLGQKIRDELGKDDFRFLQANNFVFIYNTEKTYARWVAGLYNRLDKQFCYYWKNKKFNQISRNPDFPLPVIVFASRAEYLNYMQRDLGIKNPKMLAYYNYETNRVAMYDLTADEVPPGVKLTNDRILKVLNTPRAIPMVATVIHEGTHQLMFNYGMQTRFSDAPRWLNEGMAMYFETPDLKSDKGWRTVGILNFLRLRPFLNFLPRRPANSLRDMIGSDDGFLDETALDNYNQAWAFNYFLLNKHHKKFVKYLEFMSKKPALGEDSSQQRIQDFEQFFDEGLDALDREFIQYIRKISR